MTEVPFARYRIEDLPEQLRSGVRVDPISGCWVWQRACEKKMGYGQVKFSGRVERVHRLVWQILVGEIPDGHQLNHVKSRGCRTNACCWPEHVEPVQQGAGRRAEICDHAAGPGDLHVTLPPELARVLADSGQPVHLHFHLGGS